MTCSTNSWAYTVLCTLYGTDKFAILFTKKHENFDKFVCIRHIIICHDCHPLEQVYFFAVGENFETMKNLRR